jgi:hypothetical protein
MLVFSCQAVDQKLHRDGGKEVAEQKTFVVPEDWIA